MRIQPPQSMQRALCLPILALFIITLMSLSQPVLGAASCSLYSDCVSCNSDSNCGWCNGNRSDQSAGVTNCMDVTGLTDPSQQKPDACINYSDWYYASAYNCPASNSSTAASSTGTSATSDACSVNNNACSTCLSTSINGTACTYCASSGSCSLSNNTALTCGNSNTWLTDISTCPLVDTCARFTDCASCNAAKGCGFCPTSNLCMNGTAAGPVWVNGSTSCVAQWTFGNAAACPPCSSIYLCDTCIADARCVFCGGNCIASAGFPSAYPFNPSYTYPCSALFAASLGSCPSTANIPSGDDGLGPQLTQADSGTGGFATAALVLLSIGSACGYAAFCLLKRVQPVLGRQTTSRDASNGPSILNHKINIDSSHNPYVKLVLFSLLIVMFLLIFIGLATNTYSVYSPVKDSTIAALVGTANPDSSITAGVVGLSGLNTVGGGGGDSYVCSTYVRSSEVRVCQTLTVAGGFTLFFGILSLLLSLIILLWGAFVASHAHEKGVGIGKKAPALHFHPRMFTLSAFLSFSLGGVVLMWGFSAHQALLVRIFVPYSSFRLGSSWALFLVCWILSFPQLWFFWNSVEFGWTEEIRRSLSTADENAAGGDASTPSAGGGYNPHFSNINLTTGSDDGGLDLDEADQAEAHIVNNQLTQ